MKTMEEYFQFLEAYWRMFTPPSQPKSKTEYKIVLI